METNVALDHLGHESVHGAPASRNVMQYLGAFGISFERPFDRLNLASNPPYAIEQLLFLFGGVSHKNLNQVFTSIPRRVYFDQGPTEELVRITQNWRRLYRQLGVLTNGYSGFSQHMQ